MILNSFRLFIVAIGLVLLSIPNIAFGQGCTFACNDTINISVDRDCEVFISPDIVLEGSTEACAGVSISVFDQNDREVGQLVTREFVGQTLRVVIEEGRNTCHSFVTIEDKLAPEIICPPNDTLRCDANDIGASDETLTAFLEDIVRSTAIDNCDSEDFSIVIIRNALRQMCDGPFVSVRDISFSAVDGLGNSTSCDFTLFYETIPTTDIDAPINLTDGNAIDCTDALPEVDGRPYPTIEYVIDNFGDMSLPNINGRALADLVDGQFVSDNLCNFIMTFSDQEFSSCGGSYKIVRTWTVQDWCNINPPSIFNQVIKVEDGEINIATAPMNMALDAANSDCSTNVLLEAPTVDSTECSAWTWSVSVMLAGSDDFELIESGLSPLLPGINVNFPIGESQVSYEVMDECGNTDNASYTVTISDGAEPMAVCDLRTVVTLNEDFNAKVFAASFDDGSFDQCSDVTFQVRRTDGLCDSSSEFADFVKFCCEDFGEIVMVELLVTDGNGMTSSCWAEAVVQFNDDVLDITCPADPGVQDCRLFDDFDITTIPAPVVTTRSTCVAPFSAVPTITAQNIDICGAGFIDIDWSLDLEGDNSVICSQRITFDNIDPFSIEDITFPANRTVMSCDDLAPLQSELDNIISGDASCSDVVVSEPEDEIFDNISNGCVNVLRTWTVVDWCRFPEDPTARYTQVQTIVVEQSDAPIFDAQVATVDQVPGLGACLSVLTINPIVTDDCTADQDLEFSYSVSVVSGGSTFPLIAETQGRTINETFEVGSYIATWNVTDHCGNTTTASFTFEAINPSCIPMFDNVGLPCGHVLDFDGVDDYVDVPSLSISEEFTVEAVLFYRGGEDRFITLFEYGDDNPFIGFDNGRLSIFGEIIADEPLVTDVFTHVAFTYSPANNTSNIYVNGLLVETGAASRVFTGTGFGIANRTDDGFYNGRMDEVRIWDIARTQAEILSTINDNLTGTEDNLAAYYGFNEVGGALIDASGNGHTGTFIGSLGPNLGPQYIEVNNICTGSSDGSGGFAVSGTIITSDNISIEDVGMFAKNMSNQGVSFSNTDIQGEYAFNNLLGSSDYEISPIKNDDYTNGVSTLDLILIQLHILGIQSFETPYQLIASDINNNGSISSIDLVQLRQLILGITDELPYNDSWRFISEDYEFIDALRPWTYTDTRIVSDNDGSLTDNDFIGVKIGDVNGSAQANSALGSIRSTNGKVDLALAEESSNGTIRTIVKADDSQLIYGLQIKLQLDDISDVVVTSDVLDISKEEYHVNGDMLYISWHSLQPISIKAGERLFAIAGAKINPVSTDDSYNQVYDENLQARAVRYQKQISSEAQSELIVYPNQPNPFTHQTTIGFSINQSQVVDVEIFGLNGHLKYRLSEFFDQGKHQINIDASEINLNKGIHYYHIKTQDRSLVRKMIVI
jgi:hypothetical protein